MRGGKNVVVCFFFLVCRSIKCHMAETSDRTLADDLRTIVESGGVVRAERIGLRTFENSPLVLMPPSQRFYSGVGLKKTPTWKLQQIQQWNLDSVCEAVEGTVIGEDDWYSIIGRAVMGLGETKVRELWLERQEILAWLVPIINNAGPDGKLLMIGVPTTIQSGNQTWEGILPYITGDETKRVVINAYWKGHARHGAFALWKGLTEYVLGIKL